MYSNSLMCQTDYSMHFRSEISLILKLVEIVYCTVARCMACECALELFAPEVLLKSWKRLAATQDEEAKVQSISCTCAIVQ